MCSIVEHRHPPLGVVLEWLAVTKTPFEQGSRRNCADELQGCRVKIVIAACKLLYRGGGPPSFLPPTWVTSDRQHVHYRSMARWIVAQKPIKPRGQFKRGLFNSPPAP